MIKNFEAMSDAIRNNKHPFHTVDSRPDKPTKHRFERRKVRQVLHSGDWTEEDKPQE